MTKLKRLLTSLRILKDEHPGCYFCQTRPELLVLYHGRLVCLSCLVEKYEYLAGVVVEFLVNYKQVPVSLRAKDKV